MNNNGRRGLQMMNYYFTCIFLAVGSLGQKYDPNYSNSYKNRVITKTGGILNSEESVSMIDNSFYKGNEVTYDENYSNLFEKRLESDKEIGKYHYRFDEGNPDIHGRIIRPCQVYDTFCIRKYLAEHSQCKISDRAVPEPLFRAQLTVNYPHVNLSATQVNVQYSGLKDGRVEEFYINKASDNLVITLYFPSVNIVSNDTTLKFYMRGREPVVTRGFGQVTTLSYSMTAVIPNLKDLRLDRAELTTFANSPVLPFVVGPGLAASTDPEVIVMLAAFLSNLYLDQQEAGLTQSNFYALTFIQYNLCDFGLKVL